MTPPATRRRRCRRAFPSSSCRCASVACLAWAPHVYVYCRDAATGADIRARMFAPAMNITEDPATGGAAAAFAGYLAWRVADRDAELRWVVEQGVEMQRPSRIEIAAVKEAGAVRSVRVGGTAVRIGEGVLRL